MEIYWYQDGDTWCVDAGGETTAHGSRADAFAHARQLALTNPGSQLAKGRRDEAAAARAAEDQEQPDPMLWMDQEPGWSDDRIGDTPDGTDRTGPGRYAPARGATRRATTAGRSTSPERGAAGRPTAAPASRRSAPAPVLAPPPRRRRATGPIDWVQLAGPAALGRSILLAPDAAVPAPWAGADEVDVTFTSGDPADLLTLVRSAFLARRRVVYRVPADLAAPAEARTSVDVWSLPVDFELVRDAAWALLEANAVDARDLAAPFFPWTEAAYDAGATAVTGQGEGPRADEGEVVLPDGQRAWCDGGPLQLDVDPLDVDPLDAAAGSTRGQGAATAVVVLPRVTVEQGSLAPPDPAAPTAALAPDQLEAVAEAGGRARIIAPAGSGKTRVLTERARFLLGTKQVPAAAVTMVAFNKRAQLEMQERTADLPGLQIQTLNALALAVLNGGRGFRDRGERVRTIDELAVRKLLGDLVTFPRRANTDPAAAWIDALSAVRLGLRSPQEVEAEFGGDVDGLPDVFGRYRRALAQQGAVDFDDQIYRAIEVLLAEPETRRQAQRVCRLLMVDEFQDLTPAHLLLLRLLAGPQLEIFGVGDDDQTIYGYSGASPRWLIDFDQFVPGATHHALEVNYRCPPVVVDAASNLLSHNRARVPKSIRSGRADDTATGAPSPGPAITVDGHDEPAERTVDHIVALLDAGAAPRDIVVLTRVNTTLAPIQAALFERGVPCANRDGARFLDRTGVAAALSWLAIATNGGRLGSMHVQRAARRPGRSLSPKLIEWMADQHDTEGLTRLAGRLKNEKDADKVVGFVTDIERISALARRAPTATILEFVRTDIGLDRAMQTLDAAHRGRNATAHSDDLRALISLGQLHPDTASFGAWLPTVLGGGRDDDGVALSTVHKVKGLEWPHVIVHDATQGLFPHHLSTDIEEERRVFHVAITRCQQSLVIVPDLEHPSMFLTELDGPAPASPAPGAGEGRVEGGERPGGSVRTGARPDVADLAATAGLAISWGGYDGEIGRIEADHVVLLAGRAEFSIAFGSLVTVAGRPRRLVAASAAATRSGGKPAKAGTAATVDLPPEHAHLLDALKAWRRERSRTDGVPAYVVANDRTLTEIAAVVPRTPAALLKISGIGAAKLENYGDEMLAVIDDAAPPA